MLEFFHRSYYHAFTDGEAGAEDGEGTSADDDPPSRLLGRPYGLAIAAGSDGSSAVRARPRARAQTAMKNFFGRVWEGGGWWQRAQLARARSLHRC